jgi:hypothetical protein
MGRHSVVDCESPLTNSRDNPMTIDRVLVLADMENLVP